VNRALDVSGSVGTVHRTTIGGSTAAAVLALVAAGCGGGGSGPAGAAGAGTSRHPVPVPRFDVRAQLVYGMRKQQVLHRIGTPARVVRDHGATCWQYPVNHTIRAHTENAVRLCFLSGRYSDDWEEWDGKWVYQVTRTVP
jgi:hypothetical protein